MSDGSTKVIKDLTAAGKTLMSVVDGLRGEVAKRAAQFEELAKAAFGVKPGMVLTRTTYQQTIDRVRDLADQAEGAEPPALLASVRKLGAALNVGAGTKVEDVAGIAIKRLAKPAPAPLEPTYDLPTDWGHGKACMCDACCEASENEAPPPAAPLGAKHTATTWGYGPDGRVVLGLRALVAAAPLEPERCTPAHHLGPIVDGECKDCLNGCRYPLAPAAAPLPEPDVEPPPGERLPKGLCYIPSRDGKTCTVGIIATLGRDYDTARSEAIRWLAGHDPAAPRGAEPGPVEAITWKHRKRGGGGDGWRAQWGTWELEVSGTPGDSESWEWEVTGDDGTLVTTITGNVTVDTDDDAAWEKAAAESAAEARRQAEVVARALATTPPPSAPLGLDPLESAPYGSPLAWLRVWAREPKTRHGAIALGHLRTLAQQLAQPSAPLGGPAAPLWEDDDQATRVGGHGYVARWRGLDLHAYELQRGWHWMVLQSDACIAEGRDALPDAAAAQAYATAVARALVEHEKLRRHLARRDGMREDGDVAQSAIDIMEAVTEALARKTSATPPPQGEARADFERWKAAFVQSFLQAVPGLAVAEQVEALQRLTEVEPKKLPVVITPNTLPVDAGAPQGEAEGPPEDDTESALVQGARARTALRWVRQYLERLGADTWATTALDKLAIVERALAEAHRVGRLDGINAAIAAAIEGVTESRSGSCDGLQALPEAPKMCPGCREPVAAAVGDGEYWHGPCLAAANPAAFDAACDAAVLDPAALSHVLEHARRLLTHASPHQESADQTSAKPHLGPDTCHADRDGDCEWPDCPQRRDRKPWCPLWKSDDDDEPHQESEPHRDTKLDYSGVTSILGFAETGGRLPRAPDSQDERIAQAMAGMGPRPNDDDVPGLTYNGDPVSRDALPGLMRCQSTKAGLPHALLCDGKPAIIARKADGYAIVTAEPAQAGEMLSPSVGSSGRRTTTNAAAIQHGHDEPDEPGPSAEQVKATLDEYQARVEVLSPEEKAARDFLRDAEAAIKGGPST